MAEYINMITVSSIASTLFLGGWSFFGLTDRIPVLSIVIFLIKVAFFLFLFMWLRATLPRIRYDRLMRMGWQLLLPLAVLNIVITATCVALALPWWVNGIAGLAVIVVMLVTVRQRSIKEGTRFTQQHAQGVTRRGQAQPLHTSVRLAKFDPVAPTVENKNHQEQENTALHV